MEKLGLNKIRALFKEFYESKGHYSRGSFPLIPKDDKSLLIINSGMAPMKPYFAGIKEPPSRRMTTCQKCIRTADIENVGHTSRHATFFEMLGSFSFGDYFKEESISWGWEFITEVLKMPVEKLWVTVYQDDDEAYNIWKDKIGIDESRIVKLGKEDNFWEIGAGPCGPCSEIYFDMGEEHGCGSPDCKPGCDCDRYVEFWNHVFTQFNNDGEGNYTELAQKNIDTGMGLERLACIMQGVNSIFDVDTIAKVLKSVEKITGVAYEDGKADTDISIRIITDHVRAATFMIGDKIMPGNEGRGYVLRRLIRRAAMQGRKLGVKEAFLKDLVKAVINTCGEAYPELEEQRVFIVKIVTSEEENFMKTLDQGMNIMQEYIEEMKAGDSKILEGSKAFKLHDTYGFPIELTEELMSEEGFDIDRDGFEKAMAEQKRLGKEDAAKKDFAWEDSGLEHLFKGETKFKGYDTASCEATVQAIFNESGSLDFLEEGTEGFVIVDETPFYATMGGQEHDYGEITAEGMRAEVLDVEKKQDVFVHRIKLHEGGISAGMKVTCSVSEGMRNNSARNHSATHLLDQALKDVLGDHVDQAGSFVSHNGLRFDFTHFEAMTDDQVQKAEDIVNEKIDEFLPVTTDIMSLDDAKGSGAIGLFDDKYGDDVRVVSIGDYSRELCGGIHVKNSGQIGAFKIISESGIASGVRRIEAITGKGILKALNASEKITNTASGILKTNTEGLVNKIENLKEENSDLKKQVADFESEMISKESSDMISEAEEINGIKVITKIFDDAPVQNLRNLSDELKDGNDNLCLAFASRSKDKVTFMISLTDDVVGKGYNAGKMIKEVAKVAGGGGGGKADMAQAGGKKPEKAEEALQTVRSLL